MRYATVLSATLALVAAAAVFAPKADAGVVIGVGIPVSAVAPPAYYPYLRAPAVSVGFAPRRYGHGYWAPAYRGPVYYHPGWGGYYHSGYGHGWYHR